MLAKLEMVVSVKVEMAPLVGAILVEANGSALQCQNGSINRGFNGPKLEPTRLEQFESKRV